MIDRPTAPLFTDPPQASKRETVAADAVLLRGFVDAGNARLLVSGLESIRRQAPLRHMRTPGGRRMSVGNTNCGAAGWVSDQKGYRYVSHDPETGQPWPSMPPIMRELAREAAAITGFGRFDPDACLINVYEPGTRLSLHQDRDERDFDAPIVSISLGLPATFLFGGATRHAKPQRIALLHGDVLVWGGASRMAFHGVAPLADGEHPLLGRHRVNLTLRRAF